MFWPYKATIMCLYLKNILRKLYITQQYIFKYLMMALYSRITPTKSPSFCMTTFSASLTYLMVLLPRSHDCSCYVSRWMLASPPLWLWKHTDLCAHNFVHSPDLWRQFLANVNCAWSWRLLELLLLYTTQEELRLCLVECDTAQSYLADRMVSHLRRLLTCIVVLLFPLQWG